MAEILKRKETSLILVGVCFFLVTLVYFLEIPMLGDFAQNMVLMVSVLNAMAILMALYSQTKRSLLLVQQKAHGWPYQLYLVIAIYLMTAVGFLFGQTSPQFTWFQYAILLPTGSVIYSILAFYMASACARAFRARSPQATLLLISGLIVLLGQAPLTGVFAPFIGTWQVFLGATFVLALGRIYAISITVGAIVLGVRIVTGRESEAIGMGG